MEIKIGENIKRLRKTKDITQEQLAEVMNVSGAAVSKWETGDTYPDLTLIFPLANFFEVSTDELMGYDSLKIEAEIKSVVSRFKQLEQSGKFHEAAEYIASARKKYPNDFEIMREYMWNIVGGKADNDPETLNLHGKEIMQICDRILTGCTDDNIRMEAISLKAKLIHAGGNTEKALEVLKTIPSWMQGMELKAEQLFAKDTAEFRYRVRRNMYELALFAANKLVKSIWYDDSIPGKERLSKCDAIGTMLIELRRQSDETMFAVMERMFFAELANRIINSCGEAGDIISAYEKCLCAAAVLSQKAQHDEALCDLLMDSYQCDDLCEYTINLLKTTQREPIVRLRENPMFTEMLNRNYQLEQ